MGRVCYKQSYPSSFLTSQNLTQDLGAKVPKVPGSSCLVVSFVHNGEERGEGAKLTSTFVFHCLFGMINPCYISTHFF